MGVSLTIVHYALYMYPSANLHLCVTHQNHNHANFMYSGTYVTVKLSFMHHLFRDGGTLYSGYESISTSVFHREVSSIIQSSFKTFHCIMLLLGVSEGSLTREA